MLIDLACRRASCKLLLGSAIQLHKVQVKWWARSNMRDRHRGTVVQCDAEQHRRHGTSRKLRQHSHAMCVDTPTLCRCNFEAADMDRNGYNEDCICPRGSAGGRWWLDRPLGLLLRAGRLYTFAAHMQPFYLQVSVMNRT